MSSTEEVDWGPPFGPSELLSLRGSLREGARCWDLVVVGAGICGAGIARDAALRGLSVLVLEARDIAFGTSSRSTRLVHGGVRYLEQGDLPLVFEALAERARLYAAAPHLVRPARFLFPSYRGDRLGPWLMRLGLTLYDTLDLYRHSTHEFLPPERCLELEPMLQASALRGAVEYEDAITDDARLTLTVLQDARRAGAQVLTYAEVASIHAADGEHHVELAEGFRVRCRQAVVAAGPWTGPRLLGSRGGELLTLSKGVHVVLPAAAVPVRQPLVIQAEPSRRILFAIPWGARTYLGTTDTPFAGDPAHAGVTREDEEELAAAFSRRFAQPVDPRAILSAWSGIRPLVRPERARSNTVEISRRHRIIESADGVLGLVGGKLTTFRAMSEDLVDRVVARRQRRGRGSSAPLRPCTTRARPLVPGRPVGPAEDPLVVELARRHGPWARVLAAKARRDPSGAERLVDELPYRWVEVEHAIACEGVTHLADLLRRRLPLALTDRALGGTVARQVARKLVAARGGREADVREELERYAAEVELETRRVPEIP